jgi:hypothetical protein
MVLPEHGILSKGYAVQVGVAFGTLDLGLELDKTYVPEIVAWLKALVSKARSKARHPRP